MSKKSKQYKTKSNTEKRKIYEGVYNQSIAIPPSLNTTDFLKAYGEIGWLFACVSKISQNVADSDWNAYKGENPVPSKAIDLMKKPNPFMSGYEMLWKTSMFLELRGKAFWYIAKDGVKRPREIWVLSPLDIWIVPDTNNFIKGYVYRAGAQQVPLNPDEVIFFNYPNPLNPYDGISAAQAVSNSLETDKYSAQWNRNFFYNSAEPQGIITSDNSLTDDQFERIQSQWNDKYRGVDNAKRTAILEGGATYTSIQVNQKDMDFYNLRQLNRDEILAAYGVHKSILGLTDNVSRANAETAEYIFQKHTIKPRLRFIQEKLNNEYVKLFSEDAELKFTDPVPENKEFIRDTANAALDKGITKNEYRKILNKLMGWKLDPLPDGDKIWQPVSMQPMGTALPNLQAQNNEQQDAKKKINNYMPKSIKMKIAKIIEKNNETRQNDFLQLAEPLKAEFKSIIESYFQDMRKEIVKKIEAGSKDPVDLKKWNKILQDKTVEIYTKCFKTGGQSVVNEFKGISNIINKDVGVSFNIKDQRVKEKIRNKLNNSTTINDTTKNKIKDVIEEAYNSDDGFSINNIANIIGSPDFAAFGEERAKIIAQTEVLGSLNQATLEGYHQNSDIIDGKAWLTTPSKGSRQTHLDASVDYDEDNAIPVDDNFFIGGYECQCPMDDILPPEEAVNCHCCMMPVVKI